MKVYGKTGRDYYRLKERAQAQRRAANTIAAMVVFIALAVILKAVFR